MTRFFVGVVFVAVALVTGLAAQALLLDPEHTKPPHAQAANAAANFGTPDPAMHVAVGEVIAIVEWTRGVERALWYEGVEREQARLDAEARARDVRPGLSGTPSRSSQGSCGGDWECFRECTIDHESRSAGEYGAVSPGGAYRGAFQYLASTWRSVSVNAGYGEWADTPVDQVPAWVQDAVAAFHYSQSGNQPWGGRC